MAKGLGFRVGAVERARAKAALALDLEVLGGALLRFRPRQAPDPFNLPLSELATAPGL